MCSELSTRTDVTAFEVIAALIEGPQELAGVWVFMVTAPTAMLLMEFAGSEPLSPELWFGSMAVSAVLQSLILGLLWNLVGGERAKPGRVQRS